MTLREKVEGLQRLYLQEGRPPYVYLHEVLRIVAEHEREIIRSAVIPDLTPGSAVILKPKPANEVKAAVGQAAVNEWRPGFDPDPRLAAIWSEWEQESIEVMPPVERHRPIGKSWASIEQAAGMQPDVPRWRKRMAELADEEKEPTWLSDDRFSLLLKLRDLDALRLVIESGKGEAVVPEGVAKLLNGNMTGRWMARRDHGEVICTHAKWAPYIFGPSTFMRIVDEYGDSLCGDA